MIGSSTTTGRRPDGHPGPRHALGCIAGAGLLLTAPLAAALCWLVLWLLRDLAADPPYPREEIAPLASWLVAHRAFAPLLALPALLCGLLALLRPRRPWLLALVGGLCLLPPFLAALYCLVMLVAPMYEYRAL